MVIIIMLLFAFTFMIVRLGALGDIELQDLQNRVEKEVEKEIDN